MYYGYNPEQVAISHIDEDEPVGKTFEKDFCRLMIKHDFEIIPTVKTKEDTERGTDLIMKGFDESNENAYMRIDVTLDFSNKDNMPFIYDTGVSATPYETYKMGIRIGNTNEGHKNFKDPVVVIGIDMLPHEFKKWQTRIIERLEANQCNKLFYLLDLARDAYEDYTKCGEERKDLIEKPLRKNPRYVEPKDLSKKLRILNEQQYKEKGIEYD